MKTCRPCSDDDGDYEAKIEKHPLIHQPLASHRDGALKRIVVHYGPLSDDHPSYIGSMFNVLVEWDHGRYCTETLERMIDTDLQKVLQYSIDCGLFDNSQWSSHFPPRILRQIARVIKPNPSVMAAATLRQDLDHCRTVILAVKQSFAECLRYQADESCRVLREGVCEIFIDAPAMGSNCYEWIVGSNMGLFQRCFKAQKRSVQGEATSIPIDNPQNPLTKMDRLEEAERRRKDMTRQSIEAIRSFAIRTVQHHLSGAVGDSSVVGAHHEGQFEYGNFSLLASRPKTPPQFRHVDAYEYETQYVMALQPNSEATATYVVPDPLETPEDVVRLWKTLAEAHMMASQQATQASHRPRRHSNPTFDSALVTDRILRAMNEDETIRFWIRHYGKVLCRRHRMIRLDVANSSNWDVGSILCVPGGVVHGAPRSGRFRVVLFFTGTPLNGDNGNYQYRANDQFTGPTLTATLAHRLWDKVDESCREFMQCVLRQCIWEEPCAADVDFASYLEEEIGSCHEIGEILRSEQDAKRERRRGSRGGDTSLTSSPSSRSSCKKRSLDTPKTNL